MEMMNRNDYSHITAEINKNAVGRRPNIDVIETLSYGGIKVDILEYQRLLGAVSSGQAHALWYMNEMNVRPRQLAIYIENDSARLQAGAMSYFQGLLEMVSDVTLGNMVGKFFKGAVTGESMSQPLYTGSGLVVCEPTFKHLVPLVLNQGESIIVDKGLFYMSSKSVNIQAVMQKNLSSGLFGKEGWFQIGMTGPGLVVLELDVPFSEVEILHMSNDILRVDGNFALLRSGNIDFTVERSAKTLAGSAASGEGLVNVYRGTGEVWLAPSLKIYPML